MGAAVRAAAPAPTTALPPATAPSGAAPADSWSWLAAALWDDDAVGLGPAAGADRPEWFATVGPDGPRLLVPATPRAALRAALRRHHDGHTVRERATRVAAAALTPFAPGRLLVPVGRLDDRPSPVLALVAEVLGVADPRFALTLGPPRGNRKVVVQVLRSDGHIAGFAKVGHDPVTRALVAHELDHLTRLDGRAGRLRTPPVLGRIETSERIVAVVGHLPSSAIGRRRTDDLAVIGVEVTDALGTARRVRLAETAWAQAALDTVADAAAVDLLERWAGRELVAGLAHGDLSPWNVLRSHGTVGLIDWEYALDGTPEGLDVLRGETQTAVHLLGLDPTSALDRSRRRSVDLAARSRSGGLPGEDLFLLHLVDTLRRAADPSAGDADRALAHCAAAVLATPPTSAAPTEVPAP
jgi:hypothetical protein